ncbi:MAG: hypothetical protein A2832_01945 [Candidatus Zambryskibacteria bacterium RIFCSPHIGHO2_01_FULL_44_22b]|uniref:Uncharacterized protein n=2 Tax=Candidatus Zambryskiibacteriota TaxID=1817925 RepID=A0A1G2SXV8_9BACT|nr:MAG: hypothetical protein A2832_01945 [Candidatus Zambryskibacteria bacterium RIFCSPHIGHO2_01_FULL_44_22b]OHB05274.1 MAG: hypothetical protein A3B16_02625 [Candidatus Zambryskibacteria bacterium RIFCSPLOWO2_01_FULL_45_43]
MRKYLATIHTRSHHHKKRFALLVSGGFTLLIFGIWSMATFPPQADTTLSDGEQVREFSPLESLKASVSTALRVLRSDVGNLEKGLEVVNTYDRK